MERCEFENKAETLKNKIEIDFQSIDTINNTIDKFEEEKRTKTFIDYYNKIVLDREKIRFGTFKKQWAIQGMTKKCYTYFDEYFDILEKEIKDDKNICSFYKKYCCKNCKCNKYCLRNEFIFCCKLFHVILPEDFPPIDNAIIKYFGLSNNDKMTSYKIIKYAYELFIAQNKEKIKQIKKRLSNNKYDYIRINELSDYRILDMIYWFLLNRESSGNDK
jgi:hypothetical protein